jgi:hypothetical protein
MAACVPPDRFDDVRREWIAFHQVWSTIQRRRAEQLGRIVRKRQRIRTAAVPDPHDDTLLDPLWIRAKKSHASRLEFVLVLVAAALAPDRLAGRVGAQGENHRPDPGDVARVSDRRAGVSGAGLGVLTVLVYQLVYDPAGSFGQIAVLPWVCVQLATIPTVAGIYGIAEGWLAVEGSDQWWPLTPVKPRLTAQDAAAILGGYDMTGPGVVDARPLSESGERTRP